jgi:hypothetical protein
MIGKEKRSALERLVQKEQINAVFCQMECYSRGEVLSPLMAAVEWLVFGLMYRHCRVMHCSGIICNVFQALGLYPGMRLLISKPAWFYG